MSVRAATVSSGKMVRRNAVKVLGMSLRTERRRMSCGMVHRGLCAVCLGCDGRGAVIGLCCRLRLSSGWSRKYCPGVRW